MTFPKLRFDNMRKEFPNCGCYDSWMPSFRKYWSGKLWYFSLRGYTLVLDFRAGPIGILRDLAKK